MRREVMIEIDAPSIPENDETGDSGIYGVPGLRDAVEDYLVGHLLVDLGMGLKEHLNDEGYPGNDMVVQVRIDVR